MKYTDNHAAFVNALERHIGRNLTKLGDWIESELSQNLGKPFPPASKPGQYPRKRTGRLQKSIKKSRKGATLTIGVTAPYARELTEKGRKLTADVVLDNPEKVMNLIAEGKP